MELKEYIKQSYLRPNKQVLKSLGASDELIKYLRTTPWNTNLNIIDGLISGENEENSWPKLIHIIYDNGYKMANDSDFSTLAEAYNFIKNKWGAEEIVTSNYIILKHLNDIIETDGYIKDSEIDWYKNDIVYELKEDSYSTYDDN